MFKRILVATDLSDDAAVLYPQALALKNRDGCHLSLLHVEEHDDLGFPKEPIWEEYLDEKRRDALDQLRSIEETLQCPGLETSVKILSGKPAWKAIVDDAELSGADLIVVGKGLPQQVFMGSTSVRVVRHAHVPVLVIDEATMSDDLLPVTFRRIVFPADFSEHGRRGIRAAGKLAAHLDATLLVVHVMATAAGTALMTRNPSVVQKMEQRLRERSAAQLEELIAISREAKVSGRIEESADIAATIANVADDSGDLLVIPSHGQGAFQPMVLGSTTEQLLRQTVRPVLVLRLRYLDAHYGNPS